MEARARRAPAPTCSSSPRSTRRPPSSRSPTSSPTAHGYAADDVGVYIQPQHQGVTHHVEFSLPYDATDAGTRGATCEDLSDDLAADLIAAGAYFTRPYGSWAQPVYNRDAASRDALRKVKAIFDPAGVMNPGKLCFGAPTAPRPAEKEA